MEHWLEWEIVQWVHHEGSDEPSHREIIQKSLKTIELRTAKEKGSLCGWGRDHGSSNLPYKTSVVLCLQ